MSPLLATAIPWHLLGAWLKVRHPLPPNIPMLPSGMDSGAQKERLIQSPHQRTAGLRLLSMPPNCSSACVLGLASECSS